MGLPDRIGTDRTVSADGRNARAQRIRAAIVDALFTLIEETGCMPTAGEVSERAGVSARSVFRHFRDMDTLYGAIATRVADELLPSLSEPKVSGSLQRRARAFALRRAEVFERVAPFRRVGMAMRGRSDFMAKTRANFGWMIRDELYAYFPELLSAPRALADAFELVTSFEAWDALRYDSGMSKRRVQRAMETAVLALVCRLEG